MATQQKVQEITNQINNLRIVYQQVKDEYTNAMRRILELDDQCKEFDGKIETLENQIPSLYYDELEKTKVYQLILDQPGMFHICRLVCKRWNEYLISKPRPNLIMSLCMRTIIDSKIDPYPKLMNSNKIRGLWDYYVYCKKQEGSELSLLELKREYKALTDSERLILQGAKNEFMIRCEKQQKLLERYNSSEKRNTLMLSEPNKPFYSFLIKNLIDHPIGPRLYDIFNKCKILFKEPIGELWQVREYVLPYIHLKPNKHNCLGNFYNNLQYYVTIFDIFPGYIHVPAPIEKPVKVTQYIKSESESESESPRRVPKRSPHAKKRAPRRHYSSDDSSDNSFDDSSDDS